MSAFFAASGVRGGGPATNLFMLVERFCNVDMLISPFRFHIDTSRFVVQLTIHRFLLLCLTYLNIFIHPLRESRGQFSPPRAPAVRGTEAIAADAVAHMHVDHAPRGQYSFLVGIAEQLFINRTDGLFQSINALNQCVWLNFRCGIIRCQSVLSASG